MSSSLFLSLSLSRGARRPLHLSLCFLYCSIKLKKILTSLFDLSRGDGNFLRARQEAKKGELDEQLREYINEWRKQRSKEEEELKRLKEKQAKRKEIR